MSIDLAFKSILDKFYETIKYPFYKQYLLLFINPSNRTYIIAACNFFVKLIDKLKSSKYTK